MNRRNFLKLSAGGALLAGSSPSLAGAENRTANSEFSWHAV